MGIFRRIFLLFSHRVIASTRTAEKREATVVVAAIVITATATETGILRDPLLTNFHRTLFCIHLGCAGREKINGN